jgi:hypothetical protein
MTPTKVATRQSGRSQRRSKRLKLIVPVEVIALQGESEAFREATEMLSVNAHGGLVALAANVQPGQSLRLVNQRTTEQQDCRVVSVGSNHGGKCNVGLEFVSPAANFWKISFPPMVSRGISEAAG